MTSNQKITISQLLNWLILAAGVFVIIKTQFTIPTLWEADGYYHIRMAELFRTSGIPSQLPWAKYSYFATHFADKDFLYHIFLIPFTYFSNIFYGAKVASALCAIFLWLGFYFLLKRYCAQKWIPFFLISFLCSHSFLSAIERPRPMVGAILLMLWGVHFMIRRNLPGIFLTLLAYGFLHISALYMIFYSFLIEALRGIHADPDEPAGLSAFSTILKKISFKPIVVAIGGLLASYLFHPHFPNNLLVIYLNLFLVPYYGFKGGVLELGGEFFPILMKAFVSGYPVILPVLFFLIFLSMCGKARIRFETKVWLLCALPLWYGGFFSQRYLLHAYPLILMWFAAHLSDFEWSDDVHFNFLREHWLKVCAVIFLGWSAGLTWNEMKRNCYGEELMNSHYERVGAWMRQNIPPGETVFHANWSDSQYFIGLNPQNNYFVTLDPIYMYAWNKELYQLYREVAYGNNPDPYPVLKDIFKVHYGYAGKNYFMRFIQQIAQDQRFEILGQDNIGVVFRLKE